MISTVVPDDLKPYQTDHLILLIGENPLPNLVSALLLGRKQGQVSLVFSENTDDVAKDLRYQLTQQGFNKVDHWPVVESDPTSILQNVRKALSQHRSKSVGLHYTGGTKAMAVHAYRAVERWAAAQGCSTVFSYLDARALEMVISPNDPESGEKPRKIGVGSAVRLQVETLMKLHGWDIKQVETDLALPATTAALAALHFEKNGGEIWGYWKKNTLRAVAAPKNDGNWLDEWELKDKFLRLPDDGDVQKYQEKNSRTRSIDFSIQKQKLQAVRSAFSQETGLNPEKFSLQDAARCANIFSDGTPCVEFCKFLDGTWLEMYVMSVLQRIQNQNPNGINEVVRNLTTESVGFEMDVAAMRGYQLFLFTCSSSDWESYKGNLKKRLFEGYVRSRQIGGDESRVALVCLSDFPFEIEREMAEMIGGKTDNKPVLNRHVKVFGRAQLASLENEIKNWMGRIA